MPSSLRHLIAVLLLVLLPLQALAGAYATASAPLVSCADEMMATGCCEHDDDGGAACRASACFAVPAVAPPVHGSPVAIAPARDAAFTALPDLYTSFIADGPQRPPCRPS